MTGDFVTPDVGHQLPLTSPSSKRHGTRYPGVRFRLDSQGRRRYIIDYLDSDKKRVFKTLPLGSTEKDARRERNQILERMHRGEKVVSSNKTVKELSEDWQRTQTGHLKESTKTSYSYFLDHYVLPKLGHKKVSDVSVDVVADFIAELRQVHSANTIRNCLKPLSRMFAYAVRKGLASANPVSSLDKTERPQGSQRKMQILSTDDISLLLGVKTVYRPMFLVAIFCGLRRGELLSLAWEDVDLLGATINVREGKTEAASREVVVPDFVVQELAKQFKTEGKVFPFSERNVNRALTTALERAKLDHVRFHDLRHTFASILIGQGEDVTYVADQMGHASPAITLKTYAKLFDPKNRRQEARKKMNQNFVGVVG